MTSAAIRRPFRLAIPVYVALAVHWAFQKMNFYSFAGFLADFSRSDVRSNPFTLNTQTSTFSELLVAPIRLLLPPFIMPAQPVHMTPWTLPMEFLNSYVVYVVVLIAFHLKRRKWLLYSVLISFAMVNFRNCFTAPFIIGLYIAELSHTGIFRAYAAGATGFVIKMALISAATIGIFGSAPNTPFFDPTHHINSLMGRFAFESSTSFFSLLAPCKQAYINQSKRCFCFLLHSFYGNVADIEKVFRFTALRLFGENFLWSLPPPSGYHVKSWSFYDLGSI